MEFEGHQNDITSISIRVQCLFEVTSKQPEFTCNSVSLTEINICNLALSSDFFNNAQLYGFFGIRVCNGRRYTGKKYYGTTFTLLSFYFYPNFKLILMKIYVYQVFPFTCPPLNKKSNFFIGCSRRQHRKWKNDSSQSFQTSFRGRGQYKPTTFDISLALHLIVSFQQDITQIFFAKLKLYCWCRVCSMSIMINLRNYISCQENLIRSILQLIKNF